MRLGERKGPISKTLEAIQEGDSTHLLYIRGIGAVKYCLSGVRGRSFSVLWQSNLDAIEIGVSVFSLILGMSYCLNVCSFLMES